MSELENEYNGDSFKKYFEEWIVHQEHYLDELLSVSQQSKDEDLEELISRILNHYEDYYDKKSIIAQSDIFLVFSPSWFSSYEKTLLWIGGFRPALIFKILKNSSIHHLLDEHQIQTLKRLNDDIKIEERVLNDELANIQERVAAPPLLGFLRRQGRLRRHHGTGEGHDEEIVAVKTALQSILASADLLRRDIALKVVEILKPSQTIALLVAWIQFLLRIRASGSQLDSEIRKSSPGNCSLN